MALTPESKKTIVETSQGGCKVLQRIFDVGVSRTWENAIGFYLAWTVPQVLVEAILGFVLVIGGVGTTSPWFLNRSNR